MACTFDSARPITAENDPSPILLKIKSRFFMVLRAIKLHDIAEGSQLYDEQFWTDISQGRDWLLALDSRMQDPNLEPVMVSFLTQVETWLLALCPDNDNSDDSSSSTTTSSGSSSGGSVDKEPKSLTDVCQRLEIVDSMLEAVSELAQIEDAKRNKDSWGLAPVSPPGEKGGTSSSGSGSNSGKARQIVFADEIPGSESESESVVMSPSYVPSAVRAMLNQFKNRLIPEIPLSPRPAKRPTLHRRSTSNSIKQAIKPMLVKRKEKAKQPLGENKLPLEDVRRLGSFGAITNADLVIAQQKCSKAIRDLVEEHTQKLALHFQLTIDLHTCDEIYRELVNEGYLQGFPVPEKDVTVEKIDNQSSE